MHDAKIYGYTQPVIEDHPDMTPEEFMIYCARVSNPESQEQGDNPERLAEYLMKHAHWSPFEMASVTMKIVTTRAISRQIIRHRSFSFQEFSGRYAEYTDDWYITEARLQDTKNRQNSFLANDSDLQDWWLNNQFTIETRMRELYKEALRKGIAKEVARNILPEGMLPTTLFMAGTVRSWKHYTDLRTANGTQSEHMMVANSCKRELMKIYPTIFR